MIHRNNAAALIAAVPLAFGYMANAYAQASREGGHAHSGEHSTMSIRTSQSSAGANAAGGSLAVSYRSVFDGYRLYKDEPLKPWRLSNDTVGAIGGWRAYAREAQEPDHPSGSARPTDSSNGRSQPAEGGQDNHMRK
jgi:hypothetical protein